MLSRLASKIFGTKNDRELKRMGKVVQTINALEEEFNLLDEAAVKAKTLSFKQRFKDGESLDKLLPEAFALVRVASQRTLGLRHFDVQLIGGMTLHEGRIAEMRTGEGKTLVATLPAYLNALSGKSVHIVTVNDYLANRDAQWMRPLYEYLGLSVGIVVPGQDTDTKRQAYNADISYGTNNEFGFDYLRDNMAFGIDDKAQRDLAFAIVDEVDSILIDEARTPLIISGPAEDSSELYIKINKLIPDLEQQEQKGDGDNTLMQRLEQQQKGFEEEPATGHYTVDEKQRSVDLTELGHEHLEHKLEEIGLLTAGDSLYAAHNLNLLHHVHAALKAHILFKRDVEYIVQENQIVIIDEHTGRTMPGRRWSEGIHQAVEAKEGVAIQNESQTLASTTFQNYFRIYDKLSGMTGTADTEAFEFRHIYGLDVVVIPTNKPMVRDDQNDLVFLTQDEKYHAIIEDIKGCREQGQPILVGTASIDTSERVSKLLKKEKIPHNVLNAKRHAQEAEVIAQAGRPGVVTIATNMAGRGTDIVLGGNWQVEIDKLKTPNPEKIAKIKQDWQASHQQVIDAGGLVVIGSERHESRRIDNQLRGRSGRQGDPGRTRFYLSLEDDLMRIFASDRIKNLMRTLGMENGEAIEHRMVTNAIEKAQRKVEGRNFDIRKNLLEYDDVANEQRQIIYQQRNDLMTADDISGTLTHIRSDVMSDVVSDFIPPHSIEDQWDIAGLEQHLTHEFGLSLPIQHWLDEDEQLHEESLKNKIIEQAEAAYQEKCQSVGADMHEFERQIMLQVLDSLWKEHLAQMDFLRQGIHLRSYAQKNPKQEYKRESFHLFQELLKNIHHQTIRFLSRVQIQRPDEAEEIERKRREAQAKQKMQYHHEDASALDADSSLAQGNGDAQAPQQPFVREGRKVGRNEPCPCGSGRKFKQCHGRLSA